MDKIKEALKKYPTEWFDFTNGVSVDDNKILGWLKEAVKNCQKKIKENNLTETFSTISLGNTKILVEVYKENKGNTYTVFLSVIKSYRHKSLCFVDFLNESV